MLLNGYIESPGGDLDSYAVGRDCEIASALSYRSAFERSVSEGTLPVGDIDPAIKFEAYIFEVRAFLESELLVQAHARLVR